MDILIISVSALVASCLTFFSGFGLGTILTPVFALFFPVSVAIAMTALVHLANNLFKIGLVGRDAHWPTVLRFALPAGLAAIVGASVLAKTSTLLPLASYEWMGRIHEVTPVKVMIGVVITVFALLELSPAFARLAFPSRWLVAGGLLSGFFGGLSGNQGALRSAFLIKLGLSKESYVGTGAVCTVLVDLVRIAVYGFTLPAALESARSSQSGGLVLVAVVSAFLGSYFGKRLLKKVTLRTVEWTVAAMMVAIGIGLTIGLF
ncbi:MAG TPA: sulfite exporter TauE/SafE family protein [Rhodoferax sp.]|nr:sulfite exporter TauE/SafE family protein [Rhodoferax sp.]